MSRWGPAGAVAWLRRERIVTLTPTGRVPSLVEEVVGGAVPVKGSWWGHPRGKEIFACTVALEASGEALAVKLIDGKVTFVHRALWPALYRVATDADRRRAAVAALPPDARTLLARGEEAGEVRRDRLRPAPRPVARTSLEKALLCLTMEIHTEKGSHTKVLRTWRRWADAALGREAEALTYASAGAALEAACRGGVGSLIGFE